MTDAAGQSEPPGCGVAVAALTGSAMLISLGLAMGMGVGSLYPFVLVVTLAIVATIGGPVFLVIRRHATWYWIGAGGFVTGAAIPAYTVLTDNPPAEAMIGGVTTVTNGSYTLAGWLQNLTYVGAFGVVGVIGALFAWLLVVYLPQCEGEARAGPAKLVVAAIAALILVTGIAAMWIAPWGHQDSSCHNSLRDGRKSLGSVAGFKLKVAKAEWPAVQAELQRFARENGWQMRADVRLDPGFPWFQVSLCQEPGTKIFIHQNLMDNDGVLVSISQPQGGNSWQAPARMLERQLEQRWPGRIGYDAYAPPPPWAPSSSPTDAPLRPHEKSL